MLKPLDAYCCVSCWGICRECVFNDFDATSNAVGAEGRWAGTGLLLGSCACRKMCKSTCPTCDFGQARCRSAMAALQRFVSSWIATHL